MMNDEIVKIVREKGLLLDRSLFELLENLDVEKVRGFLDNLERVSGQKMITCASLNQNVAFVKEIVDELPGDMKNTVEKYFVKLGISLEIKKEVQMRSSEGEVSYKLKFKESKNDKKVEVGDFVSHFRARYQQLQRMLMERPDVKDLVSINKISRERKSFCVIGIVTEKRKTKNKNLIVSVEDLTGKTSVLFKADSECFIKAEELQLDDVVAFKVSGNNELLFAHDIFFPDAFKEKVRFNEDVCVAFVSDVHSGSKKHLGKEFRKFINWLNSDNELSNKIKYIFFVGDNVDGVGVFPGQESLLELTSLKDQYDLLASYLKDIPKDITMFMCPGQHDSVRVAEPQPIIDNYYGEALYDISNLHLVSNPCQISLIEKEKEFKVLMYHGASVHNFINEIEELRLLKAHSCPARAVKHMLKRRHLAPSHGVSTSIVYVPNKLKDPLVIDEVPDVLCTGEVHRLDIENYNGVLIITGSCWQSQTDFEEKVGNVPDPCKVPIFNLRTRELKVLDFSSEDSEEDGE